MVSDILAGDGKTAYLILQCGEEFSGENYKMFVSLPWTEYVKIIFICVLAFFQLVSPAYGYIGSALVKCSNEGGLGPRYNREEDPGSSIFSMLMVYGCYLHLLTFSGKQVTGRINGDPFPPLQTKLG